MAWGDCGIGAAGQLHGSCMAVAWGRLPRWGGVGEEWAWRGRGRGMGDGMQQRVGSVAAPAAWRLCGGRRAALLQRDSLVGVCCVQLCGGGVAAV